MRLLIDSIPLLVRSAGVKNYLFHWIVHLRQLLGAKSPGDKARVLMLRGGERKEIEAELGERNGRR